MLTNQHLGSVASLVVNAKTIADGDKVEKAYQLFAQNTGLMCLPVIKNNRPIGIIYRELLMEYFSDIYGRALYGKKLVTEVMEPNPITIEQTLLLDEASIYITQVKDTEFSRYFIVVDQGYYLGLASIRELLRRITEAKIENARYANPLTLLPGNVPIDKEIDYLLSVGQSFYFAYIDINHFKPFNDVYGYAQGDLMLKQLARIIQNNCHDIDSFIGHVGGDDFVAIIKSEQVLAVCEMIVQAFNEQIRGFYSQQHLNDSGYYALSRNGEQVFYPLVSLAIGIIQPDVSRCLTHHEVATMATEAKAEAKKIEGGGVFECRRRSTQQGDWWVSETNEQTAVA
jgi:diguanylate cyclase (GGDEF)-like protein